MRHASQGLFTPGEESFEFKPEATPLDGEPVITKGVNSAFIGTGNLGFDTWVLGDAMATFDRLEPDGTALPADLIHRTALASLHGEFAEVLETHTAVARLD